LFFSLKKCQLIRRCRPASVSLATRLCKTADVQIPTVLRGAAWPPSMQTPTPLRPPTEHQPQRGDCTHVEQRVCDTHASGHCRPGSTSRPHSPDMHPSATYVHGTHCTRTKLFLKSSAISVALTGWRNDSVVRTSVFGWQTFLDLYLI